MTMRSTAIKRYTLSHPVQLAFDRREIRPVDSAFFDYGCGRGDDVRLLRDIGYEARGWDPVWYPDEEKRPADVVNLGFVLNTIASVGERAEALWSAWLLTDRLLIVAVRTHRPYDLLGHFESDGWRTSHGTFQKFYDGHDLEDYIEQELGVTPERVESGIAFVRREDE
jgi:DNA phosphorothioation-associated putative methyltransferase